MEAILAQQGLIPSLTARAHRSQARHPATRLFAAGFPTMAAQSADRNALRETASTPSTMNLRETVLASPCAYRKITSGHIDGAVHPGSGGRRYSRPTQRREGPGHLCSMTSECAWCCSNLCTIAERGADDVRRTPRHDQRIPSGLNRSTVLRSRSRMPIDRTRRTKISP